MEILNSDSSQEEKQAASEAVFESLADFLFDKINFTSLIFSEAKQIDGTGAYVSVTDTTNYWGTSRITDTSEGRYLNTGKPSRMRCSFYLSNPDKLDGYILSPAVYDSFGSLNSFDDMNALRSYVGIKFVSGKINIAIKVAGYTERLVETDLSFSGSGATDTYRLEIIHNVSSTELYINEESLGTYPTDMIGTNTKTKTFLPLLSPARSTDGSAVGIVIENYQFIQDR
jgi:hypothetical protein